MDAHRILRTTGPHLHTLAASAQEAWELACSLARTPDQNVMARVVRGSKARTTADLFNEMGAALQFPPYFGENWDALRDCLADLEWTQADAYVLLFTDSQQLLEREPADRLTFLLRVLDEVGAEWTQPRSGAMARPAKPFQAVFQCPLDAMAALRARLEQIHWSLSDLAK
jgi:RNAse (barnase) inhibitor barstar